MATATLAYALKLDGSGFVNPMRAAMGSLRGLLATGSQIGSIGTGIQSSIGLLRGLLSTLSTPITLAADMESLAAEFEVMLGSGEKAVRMLQGIEKFANATPFDTAGLAQSAKVLLAFGASSESIMPTLRMIGDIAGSSKDKLASLTLAFAQVSATGKLTGGDLLQMVNAGFNPLQEMARTSGVAMADLRQEMEAGQITAEMVASAFKTATSAGGRFFGNTAKQAQSFNGIVSTMGDSFAALQRALGEPITLALKPAIEQISKVLDASRSRVSELGKSIGGLVGEASRMGIELSKGMVGAFQAGQLGKIFRDAAAGVPKFLLGALSSVIGAVIRLASNQLKATINAAFALLTQKNFLTGISSTALSIVAQIKASLLDAVATAVEKLGPILGAGADSAGIRNAAAESRMDVAGYQLSARNAFNNVDIESVLSPLSESAQEGRKILSQLFAELLQQASNVPEWRQVRTTLQKFSQEFSAKEAMTQLQTAVADFRKRLGLPDFRLPPEITGESREEQTTETAARQRGTGTVDPNERASQDQTRGRGRARESSGERLDRIERENNGRLLGGPKFDSMLAKGPQRALNTPLFQSRLGESATRAFDKTEAGPRSKENGRTPQSILDILKQFASQGIKVQPGGGGATF